MHKIRVIKTKKESYMKYILTAEEMKECDRYTIEEVGIPSLVLMERAACACVEEIEKRVTDKQTKPTALVVAGRGNNGADALVIARLLCDKDYSVSVYLVEPEGRRTTENTKQLEILGHYPVNYVSDLLVGEYTVVVDGILGIGGKRALSEEVCQIVAWMNACQGMKVAVDIPTGVDTNTGAYEVCFVADVTITFGYLKPGLVMYPGTSKAGEVVVKEIGFSKDVLQSLKPRLAVLEEQDLLEFPERRGDGNKGTFGKSLLVVGSEAYPGAALLSTRACFMAGSGMIKVSTDLTIRDFLLSNIPEILFSSRENVSEDLRWSTGVLVGSGLGQSEEAKHAFEEALNQETIPLVLDADGLNLLASSKEWMEKLSRQVERPVVLTPHMGELKRLLANEIFGLSVEMDELKNHAVEYAIMVAKKLHCVVVAKDARTIIAKEKEVTVINTWGNSGMAVAGSGDVLAGLIASFISRGMGDFQAALLGVAIHAKAGDICAKKHGKASMLPSDMIEEVKGVMKEYDK